MQCILEISLKKINSNWKKINKHSNFKASAVVKANAYGFGLEEVATGLTKSGCNFFYVAQIEEGIKLRNCLKSFNDFSALAGIVQFSALDFVSISSTQAAYA